MRLCPRFREERILREQVSLVYRNYVAGLIGIYLITILAAVILFIVSEPKGVFY
jgi:hypothetical protein